MRNTSGNIKAEKYYCVKEKLMQEKSMFCVCGAFASLFFPNTKAEDMRF